MKAVSIICAIALALGAVPATWAQAPKKDKDVPADHRPPPGMCRIWVDGVPAGQQPAPTDCATAIRNRPEHGRVIFGSEAGKERSVQPRPFTETLRRKPDENAQPPRQPEPRRADPPRREETKPTPPPERPRNVPPPPRQTEQKPRKPDGN